MLIRTHPSLPGAGCVCLGSRGSHGKKFPSLAGMLGKMLWGAVAPLVCCGCIIVAPEYSPVFVLGWMMKRELP